MAEKNSKTPLLVGVLVLAAVALSLRYLVFPPADVSKVETPTRGASRFLCEWRCLETDYEVTAPAGPGPIENPNTGKMTVYSSFRYRSADNEPFIVFFNYNEDGDPTEVRIGKGGEWLPYRDETGRVNVRDPKTGDYLIPAESERVVRDPDEEDEE